MNDERFSATDHMAQAIATADFPPWSAVWIAAMLSELAHTHAKDAGEEWFGGLSNTAALALAALTSDDETLIEEGMNRALRSIGWLAVGLRFDHEPDPEQRAALLAIEAAVAPWLPTVWA